MSTVLFQNGFFDRENLQTLFWEQSHRIWFSLKKLVINFRKTKTACLKQPCYSGKTRCIQNSAYVSTPRPVHLENRQMDMW